MVKQSASLALVCFVFITTSMHSYAQRAIVHGNNIPFPVVSDQINISAGQYSFEPRTLPKKNSWQAKWIWLNKNVFAAYQKTRSAWINSTNNSEKPYRALFRQSFNIVGTNNSILLFIAADVRYKLYINGHLTEEGPVNTGSDYDDNNTANYHYFSSIDISKHVKRGINQIAIEVFSWALELSEHSSGQGKLICEIESNSKTIALSNEDWKAIVDTSYNTSNGYLEYNASKEYADWKLGKFHQWPSCSALLFDSSPVLYQSKIPALLKFPISPSGCYTTSADYSFKTKDSFKLSNTIPRGNYTFDFKKNLSARWKLSMIAQLGDTIELIPFEKNGKRPVIDRKFRYVAKAGMNEFQSPNLSAYRYLQVLVKSKSGIKDFKLQAIFTSYPVKYRGSFECSNKFYNSLWTTTRYATQLCMHDMFFDSPMHQEPNACTGDYLIESINNYYAFGDPYLTRQNLVQTAQMMEKNDYKMFHTSYSLLWVQMLKQYVLHTKDSSILRELLPHAHLLMKRFIGYLNKDFLVTEAPNYMFMDWVGIDKYNAHHPPAMIGSGYMTAFLYKAMIDLDELSKSINVPMRYQELSSNIKSGINRILWDEQKKLYRDGIPFTTKVNPSFWLPADSNLITYSAHINTLVVAYNIAPEQYKKDLMQYVITQKDYELQPYFMFYVLQAVKSNDDLDMGLKLLERWRPAIDEETGTLKENWQDLTSTGYGGDYSHGWAGAPLAYLSQNILGIEPHKNELYYLARLSVKQPLDWARGTVPTYLNNEIKINLRKEGSGYIYNYTVPAAIKLRLILPEDCSNCILELNGRKLTPGKLVELAEGSHQVKIVQGS